MRLGHCEPEPLAVARVSPGASVASRGEGAVVAFGLDLEAGVTAFHGVRDERGGCHDLAIQPTLGYALRLGGLESHQAALGLSFGPSFPPVAFLASAKLLAGALDGDFAVGVRVGARVSTFLDMLGLELSYQWDRTEVGDWHAFEARLVLDAGTLLSILLR
ncbi:MAG TPA: hypothetical protein RMH99_09295 [Sandaracinaceae bacterium LLY-WYZ-13_1]|nr:hypothetical protein [Sandaracinaceae bacterium LLY-WYZ-13_1]